MEKLLVESIKENVSDDEHEEVNEAILLLQATQLDRAYKKFEELVGSSKENKEARN